MNGAAALLVAALSLSPVAALAQGAVLQSGIVIPGHVVIWGRSGVIMDGGTVIKNLAFLPLTGGTLTGNLIVNGPGAAEFDVAGNVNVTGAGAAQLVIGGVQVVGARDTGWGVASGGSKAAFVASSATLAQTAAGLASVINALTAHGLIGQ